MSQALRSTIIPEFLHVFKIKLKESFCITLSSVSYMWYFWILTKEIVMLCNTPKYVLYVRKCKAENVSTGVLMSGKKLNFIHKLDG
jgi:predicted transglutaminase-like protease